jgi:archaellum component FlaG (FlaF/FlaG flagellin family)
LDSLKKIKEKKKVNVVRYDFEMIVKKLKHNLNVVNLPNPKQKPKSYRFGEFNYIYYIKEMRTLLLTA